MKAIFTQKKIMYLRNMTKIAKFYQLTEAKKLLTGEVTENFSWKLCVQ